jgi:hypothetical protein
MTQGHQDRKISCPEMNDAFWHNAAQTINTENVSSRQPH